MIVCVLIGFCASPSTAKSQMVQPMSSIYLVVKLDIQYNFNNWFSLNHFFDSDWSPDEDEAIKVDSLKKGLDCKTKVKRSTDSIIIKSKRSSLKKTRKTNFRNMQVVIQTRI